ncbi:MAG: type 4a pilus biogenesis protein PilO [Firmicutes bacterium]|jgi:type IV pilus assembly protein PilO|nr:type 4a pilus biogenesis protein PilO [Bacillota bacterium]
MMKCRQPPQILFVLFFLLAAASILCWLQFHDWRRQKEALAAAIQGLQASERRLAVLQEQKQEEEQLAAELVVLNRLLPDVPAEGRLLVDLQTGADLAGMAFLQIRFGEHVDRLEYMEIPLEIQLEGTYFEFLAFLDYLKLSERAMRLQEIRMDENEKKENLAVSIKASVFYLPD